MILSRSSFVVKRPCGFSSTSLSSAQIRAEVNDLSPGNSVVSCGLVAARYSNGLHSVSYIVRLTSAN